MPQKRRLRARARSALAWGLATFVVLQLGLAACLLWVVPSLRDLGYHIKLTRLRQRFEHADNGTVRVVMVGSSRTAFGLAGQTVEKELTGELGRPVLVYNFGQYGSGPVTNLLTLRRLLGEGLRPDLVLIEVMPPFLAGQVTPSELTEKQLAAHTLFEDELEVVERYAGGMRPPLGPQWRAAWLVPWYHHRFTLVGAVSPCLLHHTDQTIRGIDDSGWVPTSHPRHAPAAIAMTKERLAPFLTNFRLGGPGPAALEETVRLCRREGLPAALVLMPEGPACRSWHSAACRSQVDRFLSRLRRKYGVALIDARTWMEEVDFFDSHHLHATGARRFSESFGREGLAPLLGSVLARRD